MIKAIAATNKHAPITSTAFDAFTRPASGPPNDMSTAGNRNAIPAEFGDNSHTDCNDSGTTNKKMTVAAFAIAPALDNTT